MMITTSAAVQKYHLFEVQHTPPISTLVFEKVAQALPSGPMSAGHIRCQTASYHKQ
jgi:hypothetical protein